MPLLAAKALIKLSKANPLRKEQFLKYRENFLTQNQQLAKSSFINTTTTKPSSVKIVVGHKYGAGRNQRGRIPRIGCKPTIISAAKFGSAQKEAKSYLPRQTSFLAEEHGFFARSKITHSTGVLRGAPSSSGTH